MKDWIAIIIAGGLLGATTASAPAADYLIIPLDAPGFGGSLLWIFPVAILTVALFIFMVVQGVRAQFKPIQAGAETLLGQTVKALSRIDTAGGRVFIEGEHWHAVSATPVAAGQPVVVIGLAGLTLQVKPITN